VTVTISHCLTMLLDELREAGLANPLVERFTLAATWDDLCRLAGEATPEPVRAALGETPVAPSSERALAPPGAAQSNGGSSATHAGRREGCGDDGDNSD
jgi:hypothetical protein